MQGKLVNKEIFCFALNFPLAYRMHEGNLEDKGTFPQVMLLLIKTKNFKSKFKFISSENKT